MWMSASGRRVGGPAKTQELGPSLIVTVIRDTDRVDISHQNSSLKIGHVTATTLLMLLTAESHIASHTWNYSLRSHRSPHGSQLTHAWVLNLSLYSFFLEASVKVGAAAGTDCAHTYGWSAGAGAPRSLGLHCPPPGVYVGVTRLMGVPKASRWSSHRRPPPMGLRSHTPTHSRIPHSESSPHHAHPPFFYRCLASRAVRMASRVGLCDQSTPAADTVSPRERPCQRMRAQLLTPTADTNC